jgi:CheY-like chemotaxis protein/anti-sigma regulatory factor (Ser/Thr protein kinase)
VLDVSRIETGSLAISLEPVHVGTALADGFDLVKPLAAERDISLERPSPQAVDRYVMADSQRLKQVLLNLLSNAIKYNRENGSVTVSIQDVPPHSLSILVTDTGKGISEEELTKLFSPFERLGAEQTSIEGTGLGLTLSKLLVEAMGGTLAVESQPGVGTTFMIKLAVAEDPVEVTVPVDVGTGGQTNGSSKRICTILHIEDNLSNLKLAEQILAHRPELKLLPAMQGDLGLELAQRHHPDLILLDLHLPGMPGAEVLRRLKDDSQTRDIPVVVVSADATEGRVKRLLESGARAYLTKPIDVKGFLAVVEEALDESVAT